MLRRLLVAAALCAVPMTAHAQSCGVMAPGNVCGNAGASQGPALSITPTSWLDRWCSSSNSNMIARVSGTWVCTTTLPNAVQDNITRLGTIASIGAPLGPAFGGTGVANNAANTLTWSGAFPFTGTLTGSTNVTFPTTGTLATTATPAASIVVGSTAVTSGTSNGVLFNNAAVLGNTAAGTTGTLFGGNTGAAPSFNTDVGILPTMALPNVNFGHKLPLMDTDIQLGGNYFGWVTPGTGFSGIIIGAPNSTISGTPTTGEQPGVTLTFPGFGGGCAAGCTIRYDVQPGDTNDLIALGLVNKINQNATVAASQVAPGNGVFAYYIGGTNFNLQWHYSLSPSPVAVNSANTTVNLTSTVSAIDAVILQLGRTWDGRTTLAGDSLIALDWTGPNSTSSGAIATHWAIIAPYIVNPAAGSSGIGGIRFATGSSSAATGNNAVGRMAIERGIYLYDSSGSPPGTGDLGAGTINLPTTGYFNVGSSSLQNNGVFTPNVIGGTAPGSTVNIQSTNNGAPAGDFVQIKAGGNVGYKYTGTQSLFSNGPLAPSTSGGVALGTTTLPFSNLFLASTGIINFGAGDTTVTAASDKLSFESAATGYGFSLAALNSRDFSGTINSVGIISFSGTNYGNFTAYEGRRANGTQGSPTKAVNGDILLSVQGKGYQETTGAFSGGRGQLRVSAIEDFTSTAQGARLEFLTTPAGGTSTAIAAYIHGSGGFSVGIAGDPGAGAVLANGLIKSVSASAGIGYASGAGGTVTQSTSKSTGVTLDKITGAITMNNAALNAGVSVSFTLTNSTIAATDTIRVNIASGASADSYNVDVTAVAGGSCRIQVRNFTGGNLSEALVLNFTVIKGVTS